jgi:hypothetical protein
MQTFTAILTDPSGYRAEYQVTAENKTKARAKVAAIYRRDTPPPSAGCYSFSQNRLAWREERE